MDDRGDLDNLTFSRCSQVLDNLLSTGVVYLQLILIIGRDACRRAPGDDSSIPGNVLLVREIRFGRMGNHLIGMANDFQLGYCCKSKMVSSESTFRARLIRDATEKFFRNNSES